MNVTTVASAPARSTELTRSGWKRGTARVAVTGAASYPSVRRRQVRYSAGVSERPKTVEIAALRSR